LKFLKDSGVNSYTFKTSNCFDFNIWQNIKNDKNSKIKRVLLDDLQQKEIFFLVDYCKNFLAQVFNSLFIFEHLSKSLIGYSVYGLYKTKTNEIHETSKRCNLKVDIHKNEITVKFNK